MQQDETIKEFGTYKSSGVEWIGNIPQGWTLNRNKNVFSCGKSIVGSNSSITQLLSLTKKGVVEKDINNAEGKLPESFDTYQYVEKDDIVMCLFDLDCSAVFSGISKYNGMISPAYKVLKCQNIVPKFADYWFNYIAEGRKFKHYSKNIRYTLSFEEFSYLPILTPQKNIQQKIADYLDKKCGAIDEIIETEKSVIEKLKEYKQSIITEAVTKGLDKSVPLKDSGIEWIGKIPQHWEVKRTKYTANSFEKGNGITKEDVVEDGNIQCIRYGEIYSKYDRQCVESVSATNLDKISSPKHILKGDILFAGTGELIEEIGKNIVYMGDKPCLAGGDIIILNHNQNPVFLNYALNSVYSQAQKSYGKVKLKVVHISASAIGDIRIAIPPIEEQEQIAEYLDKKCSEIDKAIADKEQVIEKFTEYKKSLIYECVTGKKRVV